MFLFLFGCETLPAEGCFCNDPDDWQGKRGDKILHCCSGMRVGGLRGGSIFNRGADAHVLPVVLKVLSAVQADDINGGLRRAWLDRRTHRETRMPMPAAEEQVKQIFPRRPRFR